MVSLKIIKKFHLVCCFRFDISCNHFLDFFPTLYVINKQLYFFLDMKEVLQLFNHFLNDEFTLFVDPEKLILRNKAS